MVNIIETHLKRNGSVKTGNRPLFITLYDTRSLSASIEDINEQDIYKNRKAMFAGHFFVTKQGLIQKGREIYEIGEFARTPDGVDFNISNVGVCIEGDFDSEIISKIQNDAIKTLINYLLEEHNGIREIYTLKDLIISDNPGKLLPINQYREILLGKLESFSSGPNGNINYTFGLRELYLNPFKNLKGNDVYELQFRLKALGLDVSTNSVFDLRTQSAVSEFQTKYKLNSTGIVDQNTFDKLKVETDSLRINKGLYSRVLYYEPNNLYTLNGEDVRKAQYRLLLLGFNVTETGYFDQETKEAVKQFQSKNRIISDGKIGPITWDILMQSDVEFITRQLFFTTPMLYGDDVKMIQKQLKKLGYDINDINGWFDFNTSQVLKKFQTDRGLEPTGYTDKNTLRLMFNV